MRDLAPLLEDMPPLSIPDPREGGWDVRSSARASMHGGRNPTIDPIPMRHSGIVPLVHNAEVKDEDEDTHLNLMRPIRDRDQGEVRRRSGTGSYDVSELRAERAALRARRRLQASPLDRRHRSRAVGRRSGRRDRHGHVRRRRLGQGQQGALAGSGGATSSSESSPPGTTTRSAAIGLSFQPARELPPVPVAIQGAPRAAFLKDASGGSTLFVFVTGTDDTVWYLPGENSHSWLPLHGLKTSTEPAVVATTAGRLELFALRSDGVVHQRTYADGTWSTKWSLVGGDQMHGALGVLANTDGSLVVAAVGDTKTLKVATGRPSAAGAYIWSAWKPVPTMGDLGMGVALTPTASTSGYTAYVPRASDDDIMAIAYANNMWGTPVQTPLSGLPTAATSGDGSSYVFVRSAGGVVKAMNGNGQAGAGGLQSVLPPGATQSPDGRVAVVTAASSTKLRVSYSG